PTQQSRPSPYTLLFYPPRPRRDLHSFPTRRSSDLARSRKCWSAGSPPERAQALKPIQCESLARKTTWKVKRAPAAARKAEPRWKDRKSTRLNSSHRTISYAVFCLKKKKNTTDNSQL